MTNETRETIIETLELRIRDLETRLERRLTNQHVKAALAKSLINTKQALKEITS